MRIVKVTLSDILDARERRQAEQQRLIAAFSCPLVCFTMNIAGETKNTPAIAFAFLEGLRSLNNLLGDPLFQSVDTSACGCTAFLVYDLPAHQLKETAMSVEDTAIGRLYDIDVLDTDGKKLSRPASRRCLVCGGPVAVCARDRAHGLSEVSLRTQMLLTDYLAERMADAAVGALVDEVHWTPKPGLVDENNNGAHTDMSVSLFEASAAALRSYFARAFRLGTLRETDFLSLQQCGVEAESAMYRATRGVNTHKGAIYSFLLLLAALGRLAVAGGDVFQLVSEYALQDDRARDKDAHGTQGYEKYGAPGARGEAQLGFPHVRTACQLMMETDLTDAFLFLLSDVTDTNVLYRGGEDALRFLQHEASTARRLSGERRKSALLRLDAACITRRISPGGCADMLAMTIFLDRMRFFWNS